MLKRLLENNEKLIKLKYLRKQTITYRISLKNLNLTFGRLIGASSDIAFFSKKLLANDLTDGKTGSTSSSITILPLTGGGSL